MNINCNVDKSEDSGFSLSHYKSIFWDFDGVIKESNDIKTNGYLHLFKEYGPKVQARVAAHHRSSPGISRYEKIPYYFKEFIGIHLGDEEVEKCCTRYSELTKEAVINTKWVPGVLEYLGENAIRQLFFIVTGTSQEDIDWIVDKLDIRKWFKAVRGAPRSKAVILKELIQEFGLCKSNSLMIGDAVVDYSAAKEAGVNFLWRVTKENKDIAKQMRCPFISDFRNLT